MLRRRTVTVVALLSLLALGVACGGSSTDAASPQSAPPAAGLVKTRCGTCHVPVEPGGRARHEAEAIIERHKSRLRLHAEEWDAVTDYLSPRPSGAAPATSAPPAATGTATPSPASSS